MLTSPPERPRPGRIAGTLELIKFSHSVFALPFALSAMFVAAGGVPPLRDIALDLVVPRLGPDRGDGLQPVGRLGFTTPSIPGPAAARSSAPGSSPEFMRRGADCLRRRLRAAQFPLPRALPGRLPAHPRLFADQAVHRLHPRLPRPGPGGRPHGRLGGHAGGISLRPCPGSWRRRSGAGSSASTDLRHAGRRVRSPGPGFTPTRRATGWPPLCD